MRTEIQCKELHVPSDLAIDWSNGLFLQLILVEQKK